jgi:hypothetical protein
MRRQLAGTVGEVTLHPNDTVPHRGGACFDSWECSWFYHTRHPGSWGDCDAGTCLCEPGYKGNNCEKAPPANRFSCSDGRCYDPKSNGRQSEERGGNLTITVVRAINLPDTDGFGVFAGDTDAFVNVKVGRKDENGNGDIVVRQSCKVRNSLNPEWNESDSCSNMTFGVQRAGDPILIELWDADSGLEFGHDLIANATEYVIPCSIMDSIEEPETSWVEGELDPIAIKSKGRLAVPWRRQTKVRGVFFLFFFFLFLIDIFFFSPPLSLFSLSLLSFPPSGWLPSQSHVPGNIMGATVERHHKGAVRCLATGRFL